MVFLVNDDLKLKIILILYFVSKSVLNVLFISVACPFLYKLR